MPIEPQAVIEYIGVDLTSFEDVEAFKEHFNSSFVKRDLAHADKEIAAKVFGKVNGTLRNSLKGVGKELELEGIDFESIDPTEGIKQLGNTLKELRKKERAEIEASKKGGGTSKELDEIRQKYEAQTRELEALRPKLSEWETKYNELDGSVKQREAKAKEDAFYEEAFHGIKFREDLTPFAIDGFKSAYRTAYKPDFYDGGTRVLDKEGKIVMDPSKAQTYRSAQDIAKEWAEKEKLIGTAAAPPVRKVVTTTSAALGTQTQTPTQPVAGMRSRRVMPEL